MARFLPILKTITTAAVAAIAMSTLPAYAASPYDGQWVIDAPPAGGAIGAEGQYTCPALRLPFTVVNGQVNTELHRTATGSVEVGRASNSAPITGSVGDDGSVNVTWQNFHATGKLSATSGQVGWAGECGPRQATATKVQ
jgi:hypothetical protein